MPAPAKTKHKIYSADLFQFYSANSAQLVVTWLLAGKFTLNCSDQAYAVVADGFIHNHYFCVGGAGGICVHHPVASK